LLLSRARKLGWRFAASVAARVQPVVGQAASARRVVQARGLQFGALVASNRSVVHHGRAASYEHARREALAAFLSCAGLVVWLNAAALRFVRRGSRLGVGCGVRRLCLRALGFA